ncbi:hypothetical protein BASA83_002120 [Batrachochytrium salamandrivorans]|nr:hypothetical protein BASA83_002120 [Batrachochytrium salamandrivorans]
MDDLSSYVEEKGQLDIEDVRDIVKEIVKAILFLRQHGVVHGDIHAGHRIHSGLVPAIQKSRLRLLGRALDPGVENVYTWLSGGVLNGEADLDQRWLDETVEHESMGTMHDNRALAARLADFLQVAYRQYQTTLWKYHLDRLVEVVLTDLLAPTSLCLNGIWFAMFSWI